MNLSVFAFGIAIFLSSCTRSDDKKITITGSSTVAPLAREIGKRFEANNPGVRINVQMGGSSRGLADARSGLADIGMVSRALTESDSDVIGHTIALDGIAIIVHKNNPLKSLTQKQIKKIYTGELNNWNQLGGKDGEITVVNKAEGRSTLELFCKHFELKNESIKADVVIGDNEQGIKTVAGNQNAVGYVSIGTAEYSQNSGVSVKLVNLGNISASRATVRDGSFPIVRPLNFVTDKPPVGLSKTFIEFATSPQMNDLIEGQFFVPLGP